MSYDPQDAPDYYMREIRRLTDIEGRELVLCVDQDGTEFVMDVSEWEEGRP